MSDIQINWNEYAKDYDVTLLLKPYRNLLRTIAQKAAHHGGKKLLDVSCGTGNLGYFCSNAGYQPSITGVDVSEHMLARAQKKSELYASLKCADLEDCIPCDDASFDAVVSCNRQKV